MLRSINPTTEELLSEHPLTSDLAVEAALAMAEKGFRHWRRVSFKERGRLLRTLAKRLEEGTERFALLMAREMGKPLAEGRGEIHKCALAARTIADTAEEDLLPEEVPTDARRSLVRYDPLGTILAIMPWNFPFWQVFRAALPGLAAGNVFLVKHSENTPQCALAVAALFQESGFPDGVVQNLFLTREKARLLIEDHRVRGVTLTGSTRAGRSVAERAGRSLKPVVLELGGSDPFIVFEDANVEEGARQAALSRCINNGQSCIAAKRFLVSERIYTEFRAAFIGEFSRMVVGDPLDGQTTLGPLARRDLRDQLADQVRRAEESGATVSFGGAAPDRRGFFFEPTVLEGLLPRNPVWHEELFGPVAMLVPFGSEQEALQKANDSPYGLGASVWTGDETRGERIAADISAGSVYINHIVKSDPRLPFGGIKDSGFGRELAREGARSFVNVKTVWVHPQPGEG